MTDTSEVQPAPPEPTPSLLDQLGPWATRRMTPRQGIAIGGAGALIAVAGAVGIGGDQLATDDGDLQRIPGVLISLVLIVAGLAVLRRVSTGPLATAASTAVALGVPALLIFATATDDEFPPFSFDVTLLVATLAWLGAYAVGPARGRMVLLALALVFAPVFVMEQVEDISSVPESIGESFSQAFSPSDFDSFEDSSEGFSFDEDGEIIFPDEADVPPTIVEPELPESPDFPDPTNLGLIAIVFGLAYVAAGHLLSRRGYEGTGTPPSAIGSVLLLVGVLFLADDLKEIGSGIVLVILGLVIAAVGAVVGRRFTTWFGGGLVGIGVVVLVTKALGEDVSTMTASIVFLLVGIAVVCAAHLLSVAMAEPDEEDERRSFGPETRRGPDASPALEVVDE